MAAGNRLEKRNRRAVPLRTWLLYLAIATFALTGVTFSRYVASAYSQDTARVAAFGDLTVTDSGKVLLQPGVAARKNLTVRFESSEVATYIFVEVQANGWTRDADNITYRYRDSAGMTWRVDDGWRFLTDNNGNAVYYRELAPNTALEADIISGGTVEVSEKMTRSQLKDLPGTLNIRVQAAAVQREGTETPQAAWERSR